MIECQHFSASLGDSLASAFGDAECANSQFGDLEKTQVIGDGANNDDDVAFLGLAGLDQATDALKRDDWSVDARHKQTLQDDFVELLVSTAVQEAVQLKVKNERELLDLCNFVFLSNVGEPTTKNSLRGYVKFHSDVKDVKSLKSLLLSL